MSFSLHYHISCLRFRCLPNEATWDTMLWQRGWACGSVLSHRSVVAQGHLASSGFSWAQAWAIKRLMVHPYFHYKLFEKDSLKIIILTTLPRKPCTIPATPFCLIPTQLFVILQNEHKHLSCSAPSRWLGVPVILWRLMAAKLIHVYERKNLYAVHRIVTALSCLFRTDIQ